MLISDVLYVLQKNWDISCSLVCVQEMYIKYGAMIQGVSGQLVCMMEAGMAHTNCP